MALFRQVLAHLGAQLLQRCELADGLGQFVVRGRHHFSFDALNLHSVTKSFPRQSFLGVILRVGHRELFDLSDPDTPQVLSKRRHGMLAAHVDDRFFRLRGRARGRGRVQAPVTYRNMIIVGGGTICHHLEGRRALAQFLNGFVDVGVGDGCLLLFDFKFLVGLQLKVRINLEGCLAGERLFILEFQVFKLRLADDLPLLFFYRGLEKARNQGLGYFTANVALKMPADQRNWSVTGTKARNARALGELPGNRCNFALHGVCGYFNDQFFFTGCGFHSASKAVFEGEMRTAGSTLRTRFRFEKARVPPGRRSSLLLTRTV